VIAPLAARHPGLSGVHPLTDGHDAFAARAHLARTAARTLDLQYYIWHADLSGTLLFDEVRRAADRGVRVRMLLDDNSTSGLDPVMAALEAHPNVEVRLFNPFVIRSPRVLGYLTDFPRLNRRMHNKAFIADNQAAVIGGRNIGDEYLGAGNGTHFADLDLIAVGPVIGDLSRPFDDYWASGSSYPANRILQEQGEPGLLANAAARTRQKPEATAYRETIVGSDYASALLNERLAFEWAPTRMAADDPAKGLDQAPREALLWPKLQALLGQPRRELGLVSGYFVPTEAGADYFTGLADEGVQVKILTNAFEATDVPIVHSGYAKWRKPLLRAGIQLYEMRGPPHGDEVERDVTAVGSTGSGARGAGSALHAKTFAVDGRRLFVGSFNFDPRSAHLNTELGFVVDSPVLARRMGEGFAAFVPENSYRVELANGELIWRERVGQRLVTHHVEPGTSWWQRALVRVLSALPIEWLL
jgi:putative cardiolipin synthase